MLSEKLLILDLDETLIHASATKVREDFDFQVFHYFVYRRPGLTEFLTTCAQHFRLLLFLPTKALIFAVNCITLSSNSLSPL